MKTIIILISFTLISSVLIGQENIIIGNGNIITDTKNIFTIQPATNYLTATDIQSGISKSLTVPQLNDMSDIVIKCANSTPDGYALGALYAKPDTSKKNRHIVFNGIFFYDKDGNYKSMFEFPDREFYAVAP